ncbi:MAG: mycofactocin-associated electron transfer flavoprotein beta subunit [Microthrixaceae bacterium]
MLVAACVKWVDLRPEVDRVHGTVRSVGGPGGAGWGVSEADRAAVEVALQLGAAWDASVAVVCAGSPDAEPALRGLLAAGVDRAVRVDTTGDESSHAVAVELASVLSPGQLGADVVVCGDHSADRGSGTVPAFLAHHLHGAQALGLVRVEPVAPGRVRAVRRLDGGRREVLEAAAPMVLSVEGSVAELRRAPLSATLAAGERSVEVRPGRPVHHVEPPRTRPWRPPPRVVAAPSGDGALDRVVQLTGALVERNPPRTVELEPAEAARAIMEQLRTWGYLPRPGE